MSEEQPTNTVLLFREDAYLQQCTATVTAIGDAGELIFDQTVFYPTGGGQPGDQGQVKLADGTIVEISTSQWQSKDMQHIAHIPSGDYTPPAVGDVVELSLDWPTRFKRMRIHTALHLLSVILPYPVTGGSIGDGEGRLDFDIPESILDKEQLTQRLQAMVDQKAAVSTQCPGT